MTTYTEKEAIAYLVRWVSNGMLIREPFSMNFEHETMKISSVKVFKEVVGSLGGWVTCEDEFYRQFGYQNESLIYKTKAVIMHEEAVNRVLAYEQRARMGKEKKCLR